MFNTIVPPALTPFLEQLHHAGFTARGGKIVCADFDENFLNLVPADHVEGLYGCLDYYRDVDDPFSIELLNRYEGLESGCAMFAAGSACAGTYRALMLWEAAVSEAGSLNQKDIIKALDHGSHRPEGMRGWADLTSIHWTAPPGVWVMPVTTHLGRHRRHPSLRRRSISLEYHQKPDRRHCADVLQVENEAQSLVDCVDLLDGRHSSHGNDAFGGDDPDLVTSCVRRVVQTAAARLQLDVASKPIRHRSDGHYHDEVSGAVVEDVSRHHDGWPDKCRLVPYGVSEIDVVDLASPDQLIESHSWRSSMKACHLAGSWRSLR